MPTLDDLMREMLSVGGLSMEEAGRKLPQRDLGKAKAIKGSKKRRPAPEPEAAVVPIWDEPWLDRDTGMVWVYQGYGEYLLMPPEHKLAQLRLKVFEVPRYKQIDKQRLTTFLTLRTARLERERKAGEITTIPLAG